MSQPAAVIVNGNNPIALSVIRALGGLGIPIISFLSFPHNYRELSAASRSSRFIRKKIYFRSENYEESLFSALISLGSTLKTKAVLLPVSDEDMIIISRYRSELSSYYRIMMPSHEMIETLVYKDKFYKFAKENSLPVPETYFPDSVEDVKKISRSISYPCILKPKIRDQKWKKIYRNKKAITVYSQQELIMSFQNIHPDFKGVMIQEIVGGKEQDIYCSFTYLNKAYESLAMFTCRKIRQYPVGFGDTAMVESVWSSEISRLTKNICKKLKLTGYISIEFKKHPADGQFKIFEITPSRFNRQIAITTISGVNIPYIWYKNSCGFKIKYIETFLQNIKWVCEVNDLRSLPVYLKSKEWRLLEWILSYRNVKGFEVLSIRDPVPTVTFISYLFKNIVRKIFEV